MDTLSLRLFIRIAERGVFAKAARDLTMSPATAGARLAKLEEQVGARLFHRTTRAVSLTTDGAAFLPYARQVIETLSQGMSAVGGHETEAQGRLRMTLPGSFGRMHVVPYLAEFALRYPRIELDLRLSDEVLDVVAGAFDLIIRNAPLSDSNMVARKLVSDRRMLVAAPSYLARFGTPQTPADLANHRCVTLADHPRWRFADGQSLSVPRALSVNDGEAMRMLLEQGFGVGVKSVWNAYQSLQSGKLVALLPDDPLADDVAVWALYPSSHVVTAKVRVMIDFLHQCFHPVPPWENPSRQSGETERHHAQK